MIFIISILIIIILIFIIFYITSKNNKNINKQIDSNVFLTKIEILINFFEKNINTINKYNSKIVDKYKGYNEQYQTLYNDMLNNTNILKQDYINYKTLYNSGQIINSDELQNSILSDVENIYLIYKNLYNLLINLYIEIIENKDFGFVPNIQNTIFEQYNQQLGIVNENRRNILRLYYNNLIDYISSLNIPEIRRSIEILYDVYDVNMIEFLQS